MSDPQPIVYASHDPMSAADDGHLRTLAICHYVWGGLTIAFASLFIFYIVIGAMISSGAIPIGPVAPRAGATTRYSATSSVSVGNGSMVVTSTPNAPMPSWMGYFFIGIGVTLVTLGWTLGILTIVSGRSIANRRRRVFSLVIAGINCASFPFGTLLGVFTFIILLRPSVKQMYDFRAS